MRVIIIRQIDILENGKEGGRGMCYIYAYLGLSKTSITDLITLYVLYIQFPIELDTRALKIEGRT